MADYIYLLENRLSPAQRSAMQVVRDLARTRNLTVFLVGGAVRDLTSGSPVRDLDLVVQGEALKLKSDFERAGAVVTGESKPGQALFLRFPGNVRMEIGSALSATYPKPGKPVMKAASILDDLRRRDFTANAMALSLNPGSYGLLMDPLNGVADIENRQLRLASNYGFIEDPVRMIRAARLMARLGWTLEEKTEARYHTGKQENYISALSEFARGYEIEEIVHEEDPMRILKRLESEGWMKILAPFWTSVKANTAELERLRESQTQLQLQGIHPDPAAINFPLLTAKLSATEVAILKKSFPRQGFVAEIESLEADTKELASQLSGKASALASQTWKLLSSARPEIVLSVAHSSKNQAIQAKFTNFYTVWPQARQKIPYLLLQEMRIVPEVAGYNDLLETLFFQLMDGNLSTPEEMKTFLEPYSPPAPPPPVNLRRARAAAKKTAKSKSRAKKAEEDEPLDEVISDDTVSGEIPDELLPDTESEPAQEISATPAPPEIVSPPAAVSDPLPAPVPGKASAKKSVRTAPAAERAVAETTKVKPAKLRLPPAKPVPPVKAKESPAALTPAKKATASTPAKASPATAKVPAKVPVKVALPAKKVAVKQPPPSSSKKEAVSAKAQAKPVIAAKQPNKKRKR